MIGKNDNVLIIYFKNELNQAAQFRAVIEKVTKGSVQLLDSEEFLSSIQPVPKYDIVFSNSILPQYMEHTDELLALIIKVLKPGGKLIATDKKDLTLALKLNGFINIEKEDAETFNAYKPAFEVGSRALLNLSDRAEQWKIDNSGDDPWLSKDDGDLIEEAVLIDKDDLTKPDKESLRVCSTSGKRKACADCSCGLAEELKGEQKKTPKSSCGSCYLGDAFRCATCPYLGTPAFKPGETVKLDLDSDM